MPFNSKKRFVPLKMLSENGECPNCCLDFAPKKSLFPDWVVAMPDAVIRSMEKMPLPPNPYGFNFWCKIVAGMLSAGTGSAIGSFAAGLPGGTFGGISGMAHGMSTGAIGGFNCDRIEADLAHREICKKINDEICPMLKYNLKKLRPVTVGLEDSISYIAVPARRCPPCELRGEISQSSLELDTLDTCSASNPIVPPMQVKIASMEKEVCAEFQFDLDTGSVSAHDCPKPFVEPSDVFQALPEIPVPDDCPDFGFLGSDLSGEGGGSISEGDIGKICKILEFSAKSDIPEGCLPSIPSGFKALTLGNLLSVVPKCHF